MKHVVELVRQVRCSTKWEGYMYFSSTSLKSPPHDLHINYVYIHTP